MQITTNMFAQPVSLGTGVRYRLQKPPNPFASIPSHCGREATIDDK